MVGGIAVSVGGSAGGSVLGMPVGAGCGVAVTTMIMGVLVGEVVPVPLQAANIKSSMHPVVAVIIPANVLPMISVSPLIPLISRICVFALYLLYLSREAPRLLPMYIIPKLEAKFDSNFARNLQSVRYAGKERHHSVQILTQAVRMHLLLLSYQAGY